MPRADAVSSVTGTLLERGWSRVRCSRQGLDGPRPRQMARAARGHRAVVFKPIRAGGCHTRAEFVRQLDYLTTKSSHIVDSRGALDGKQTLTVTEIDGVADRFARRWSDGFHPKLGQTTHMLMSFPIGTRGADVRDIVSEVCERYFASDERHFDYLIAVHEDREHPHAHVVLNRLSQEGEFFYLGRDHHFNYDDIRAAMVEAGERHGVRLEATRRIDRGAIDYAPRTREVYAARDEGRVPEGRPRVGRDLKAAQAAVREAARTYRQLWKAEGQEKVREALRGAGKLLSRGEHLVPEGDVYAAGVRALDAALERSRAQDPGLREGAAAWTTPDDFHADDEAIEERCEAIREELRNEGLGETQIVLRTPAIGERARAEIEREQHRWLDAHGTGPLMPGEACRWDADGRAVIIDPRRADEVEAMVARMRALPDAPEDVAGAVTAALRAMYPGRKDEEAMPDHLARGLGRTFAAIRELREAEREAAREVRHAAEARAYLAQEAAGVRRREAEALAARQAVRTAWNGLERHSAPYPEDHPEIARVVVHERTEKIASPFAGAAGEAAYRHAVEKALDGKGIAALRAGDADAFAPILADRLDRLHAAKVYLQADLDPVVVHGATTYGVIEEIADREVEAMREAEREVDGLVVKRGPTH